MDLSITEKKPAPDSTKKETRECYNYEVKNYLIRNY